jgi:probable HAF family extracellular repeat protein
MVCCGSAHAQQYTVTALGTLGGTETFAAGINNAGQVVGYATTAGDAATGAVLWNGATPTVLGALGGATHSAATAINDAGQVVGYAQSADYTVQAAVLWNGTTPTNLGALPGGSKATALGINNAGQVVGSSETMTFPFPIPLPTNATLWSGNTLTDLGTVGGDSAQANGINQAGTVVGSVNANGGNNAVVWNGTTATQLASLGGNIGGANAINNAGTVVGSSAIASGAEHAAEWNGTSVIDLGTLGGVNSEAVAINGEGVIVGSSDTSLSTDATIWVDGKIIDLNSLVAGALGPGITLTDAVAINDSGQIAANAVDDNTGAETAYLLTPAVPLPTAVWLLGPALAGFVPFVRRTHKRVVWGPVLVTRDPAVPADQPG